MGHAAGISFRGIGKRRGRRRVLEDVTFDVAPVSVVGLAGSNGAGKTTLLGIAAGLIRPTDGEVRVLGLVPGDPRLLGKVGAVLQDSELPPDERVGSFLEAVAKIQGIDRPEREVARWMDRLAIADRARDPCKNLSHGLRQRVALAQALLGDPPILLLDEPTGGLDDRSVRLFRSVLGEEIAGRTVLLASQDLHELDALADRIAVMHEGRVLKIHRAGGEGGRAVRRVRRLIADAMARDGSPRRAEEVST